MVLPPSSGQGQLAAAETEHAYDAGKAAGLFAQRLTEASSTRAAFCCVTWSICGWPVDLLDARLTGSPR
ncbi:hypothetical protein [Variovorax sp. NFACC26]|uniref:hypothetical protein n=1 Tax=Variovorax sp. NFACC26 TaxID=1566275 RepID=UPI003AAAA05D